YPGALESKYRPDRTRHRMRGACDCRLQSDSAALAARLDEPSHLRCSTAIRCAALHRRLRAADRRHHRPTGHQRRPDSNRRWIKVGGKVSLYRKSDSAIMVMKSSEEGADMMRPTCWMARWIGASLL